MTQCGAGHLQTGPPSQHGQQDQRPEKPQQRMFANFVFHIYFNMQNLFPQLFDCLSGLGQQVVRPVRSADLQTVDARFAIRVQRFGQRSKIAFDFCNFRLNLIAILRLARGAARFGF
ncbi:MAG: hypothetical protein WAT09_15620 [Paracoccaceae bacterium]